MRKGIGTDARKESGWTGCSASCPRSAATVSTDRGCSVSGGAEHESVETLRAELAALAREIARALLEPGNDDDVRDLDLRAAALRRRITQAEPCAPDPPLEPWCLRRTLIVSGG